MDSVHKKPYEVVIIGRYMGCGKSKKVESLMSSVLTRPDSPKKLCLNHTPSTNIEEDCKKGDPCIETINDSVDDDQSYTNPTAAYKDVDSCISPGSGGSSHVNFQKLCKPFVFVCVKSQTHSQKPFLGGIYLHLCVYYPTPSSLFVSHDALHPQKVIALNPDPLVCTHAQCN